MTFQNGGRAIVKNIFGRTKACKNLESSARRHNTAGRSTNMQAAKTSHDNWSEHQTTMFSSLHKKQKEGKYCDVILKCCDSQQTFNAHSCVLSSASHVLDKLLQEAMEEREKNALSEDATLPKLMVTLPADVHSSCVESLLNFIYSGNIDLGLQKEKGEFEEKSNAGRISTRSSSQKGKSQNGVQEQPQIEISSLYIFLKAARCLEIKTLTEHLESAATLAKMKTGTPEEIHVPDRPPRRASAIKFQKSLRSTLIGELEDGELDSDDKTKKLPKNRKRKQVASPQSTKQTKPRITKKKNGSAKKTQNNEISQNINLNERKEPEKEQNENILDNAPDAEPPALPENHAAILNENDGSFIQTDPIPSTAASFPGPINENKPQEVVSNEPSEANKETDLEEQNTYTNEESTLSQSNELPQKIDEQQISHDTAQTNEVEQENKLDEDAQEGENMIQNTKPSIFLRKHKKRSMAKRGESKHKFPQECRLCGKECKSAKNLSSHMRCHDRPQLSCSVCGQTFKYKSALKKHLFWHSGEGQKCPICGKSVFTQRELTLHMSTHNAKKMRTQCNLCQKWFTSSYVMQLHMRTHSGTELFVCRICEKKFPYKSSLKMHMMLHTGEKPFMCSVCGKSFTQKIHAREHELQHAGYKRFQCQLCDRYFAHKCGLTRHVDDIHNKSRPFVCETCGKSFPRKTKLIEHIRIHTGEKPYICDLCGARYKANRSLKCHKKNRHNIFIPNYQVGIWKKGTPPEPPPSQPKKTSKFSFPIQNSMVMAEPFEKDETVINDTGIAKEVDVIATVQTSPDMSPSSRDGHTPHFDYPLQRTDNNPDFVIYSPEAQNEAQETLMTSSTAMTQIPTVGALPSLSTLHAQTSNKTFIVPLNASAASSFPVMCNQTGTPLPGGMMVTYMMPTQVRQEVVNIPEQPLQSAECPPAFTSTNIPVEMSRSASVPPMSTFRRNSGSTVNIPTTTSPVFPQNGVPVSLPGMHTFQPVALPMSVSQFSPQFLTRFTMTPGVPVLVPATAIPQASDSSTEATAEQIQTLTTPEWPPQFVSPDSQGSEMGINKSIP